MKSIDYKYSEDKLLKEITEYVNNTYDEHYAQGKYQATEFIIDGGHGIGFTVGNILKYAQRYGHKGTPEDWRKDIMKVIHYAIMALHVHDSDYEKTCQISEQSSNVLTPDDLAQLLMNRNRLSREIDDANVKFSTTIKPNSLYTTSNKDY